MPLVAALRVERDRGLRLGLGLGGDLARRRLLAAPLDEAARGSTCGPIAVAVVEARLEVVELVGIVADVARGRHARGDVEHAVAERRGASACPTGPGRSALPARSTISAPAGTFVVRAGPDGLDGRRPRRPPSGPCSQRPRSTSSTRACVKARPAAGGMCARRLASAPVALAVELALLLRRARSIDALPALRHDRPPRRRRSRTTCRRRSSTRASARGRARDRVADECCASRRRRHRRLADLLDAAPRRSGGAASVPPA